jgi:type VI protein secretion system component Hcp
MDETKKQPKETVESAAPTLSELPEAALEQVAGGTTDPPPTESISLNFTKIQFKYEPQ